MKCTFIVRSHILATHLYLVVNILAIMLPWEQGKHAQWLIGRRYQPHQNLEGVPQVQLLFQDTPLDPSLTLNANFKETRLTLLSVLQCIQDWTLQTPPGVDTPAVQIWLRKDCKNGYRWCVGVLCGAVQGGQVLQHGEWVQDEGQWSDVSQISLQPLRQFLHQSADSALVYSWLRETQPCGSRSSKVWLCLRSQGELVWYFASILISIMCQRVVDCVVLLHDQKAGGNMTRVNICLNAIIKPLQNKISHQPYVGFPAVVPSTVRFCSCRLLLRPAANSCTQSTSMCERIK